MTCSALPSMGESHSSLVAGYLSVWAVWLPGETALGEQEFMLTQASHSDTVRTARPVWSSQSPRSTLLPSDDRHRVGSHREALVNDTRDIPYSDIQDTSTDSQNAGHGAPRDLTSQKITGLGRPETYCRYDGRD